MTIDIDSLLGDEPEEMVKPTPPSAPPVFKLDFGSPTVKAKPKPKVNLPKLRKEQEFRRKTIDPFYVKKIVEAQSRYIRTPVAFEDAHFVVDVSEYTETELKLALVLHDICWFKQTDWLSQQAVEQTLALRQAKWLVAFYSLEG